MPALRSPRVDDGLRADGSWWPFTLQRVLVVCLVCCAAFDQACARTKGLGQHDGGPEDGNGEMTGGVDGPSRSPAMELACGDLLDDTLRFLRTAVDRDTGLPYDHLPAGGPYAGGPTAFNPAFGVFPQLAYADLQVFTEDATAAGDSVEWSFDDAPAHGDLPDLFYALKIAPHLHGAATGTSANRFGGIIWRAQVSAIRYATLKIRYRTASVAETWQLKLNAGSPAVEAVVDLPGSPGGGWVERTFSLDDDFPGIDLARLNYVVVAADEDRSGESPTVWIDRLVFALDPAQADACGVSCAGGAPYPDLSCYEPQTGAVNVANALAAFALAPLAGRMQADEARVAISKILRSIEAMPVRNGWMTDWHSAVSGAADPRNPIASLTDQPQLYAALMIVETSVPELAAAAAALRTRFDFAALREGGAACPGSLHWAMNTCGGAESATVDLLGNDSLLGEFLAVASGGASGCYWSEGLARHGCSLDGPAGAPWYTTGRFCVRPDLPGSDTGGPFLQLAPLIYLDSARVPLGDLSLGDSAAHMLLAQAQYAAANGLALYGWSNSSDPDRDEYLGCGPLCSDEPGASHLCPGKVTPYVSAMGLDRLSEIAARNLAAFAAAGAAAPFRTTTQAYDFGLRDAWNIAAGSGRDAFLYLDAGWTVLGLLNACHGELVRSQFAEHPVARAGYDALGPICAQRACSSITDVRIAGQTLASDLAAVGPVRVEWSPSSCPAVVQAYHRGAVVLPVGDPNQLSKSGVELTLPADVEPYEVKIWTPGTAAAASSAWVHMGQSFTALDDQPAGWRACSEAPTLPCDGTHPSCCAEPAPRCRVTAAPMASEAICSALRLIRDGADNCHFYFDLPPSAVGAFSLALRFRIDERGACNNAGAASSIQAVEFSLNDWTGSARHEWALQWENVADAMSSPAPTWRLWQPGAWQAVTGAGTPSCPAQGDWHRLRLEGTITDGRASYTRVSIDCQDADVAGVPAATTSESSAPRLTVAIQLDVASGAPSYEVLIDDVDIRFQP